MFPGFLASVPLTTATRVLYLLLKSKVVRRAFLKLASALSQRRASLCWADLMLRIHRGTSSTSIS